MKHTLWYREGNRLSYKPVKIKLGDSTTKLVKASEEDEPAPAKKVAVKKITAKKAAAKSAEKAPAAKTARAAATKTPVTTHQTVARLAPMSSTP